MKGVIGFFKMVGVPRETGTIEAGESGPNGPALSGKARTAIRFGRSVKQRWGKTPGVLGCIGNGEGCIGTGEKQDFLMVSVLSGMGETQARGKDDTCITLGLQRVNQENSF